MNVEDVNCGHQKTSRTWEKVFSKGLDGNFREETWVGVVFAVPFLACAVIVFFLSFEWKSSAAITIFGLCWLCVSGPTIVRKAQNRRRVNVVYRTPPVTTIKYSVLRSEVPWGIASAISLGVTALLVGRFGALDTPWTQEGDPKNVILGYLSIMFFLVGGSLWLARPWRTSIELTSRGIRASMFGRFFTDFSWDEIDSVRVVDKRNAVDLELVDPRKPVRTKLGTLVSGWTLVSLGGYSVEPNALYRVISELVERPELRPILDTEFAAEYVCAGPAWRDVQRLEVGAEVPVSLSVPRES